MSTSVYIRPGFWVRTAETVKGALDFRAAMRDVMTAVNVPFSDSCCSPDANTQPVRYNAATAAVEHFNGNNWSSVAAQPGSNDSLMAAINAKAQFQASPATANATGSPGQIAFDSDYFYICVAINTWKRTPLASW